MTLMLYLSGQLAARIVAVLVGLTALGLSLDLLENSADIIDNYSIAGVGEYALLRAPLILVTILPLGVLVGVTLGFLALAVRNEMVVLRAAGFNTVRVIVLLLPLAAICGAAQSQLVARIGPAAERSLVERFPVLFKSGTIERELWLRDRSDVIRTGRAAAGGTLLGDVTIFQVNAAGSLTRRIDAATASYVGDGWLLTDVIEQSADETSRSVAQMSWKSRLTPGNVLSAARRPELVDAAEVREVLSGSLPGARSTAFYSIQLWRGYSAYLTPLVMFLFGAMASFGLSRSGGGFRHVALGLLSGACFVLTDGVFTSLGESGAMGTLLAAFLAPGLFLVAGLWSIVVIEE